MASDRKEHIIAFIEENGKATSAQLAQSLGLTQVRVRAIVKELVAGGAIEKIGNYRYTEYKIKD